VTVELLAAEMKPQAALGVGVVLSQGAGALVGHVAV
jgi:hypothetical protein